MPDRVRPNIELRETVASSDPEVVHDIVSSTGFFSAAEADVAVELVHEHLQRGTASGYHFLFAEQEGRAAGYVCYGPIACTIGSYDLFWIAVHEHSRRHGLGKVLLRAAEERIARAGGRRVYIETSGREQYTPTRQFYERCGYKLEAVLKDFYAPGDDKLIYSRAVQGPGA